MASDAILDTRIASSKPKVLLIDIDTSIAAHLKLLNFSVEEASFGIPYTVKPDKIGKQIPLKRNDETEH